MKLSKILRLAPRTVGYQPVRYFGGAAHKDHHDSHGHHAAAGHDSHHHEEHSNHIPGEVTEYDLEKYRHLFPRPTREESTLSAHNIIANNPVTRSKAFLEFLAENVQEQKTVSEVEAFVPPRAHENGVFLYQSKDLANEIRQIGAAELLGAGATVFVMHNPLFVVPVFGLFYFLWGNAYAYELRRRFVSRLDFLPHLEAIQVQKTTYFGTVYNKIIRIQDLEKVEQEAVKDDETAFWGLNKTHIDMNLIFRDKSSGEYLLFDKQGYWNDKGISHELLN